MLEFISRAFIHHIQNNLYKFSFRFPKSFFSTQNNRYKVNIVPALSDNYMYVLIDKMQNHAIAIDPVEPDKILDCVKRENSVLKAILTTHHHLDHAGGNMSLCEKVGNIPVYGGDDRIDGLTTKLNHNEIFTVNDISIKCLHTPCHTSGHVCYFVESINPICFTGDTLFIGGCGRFFEGSAEQMFKSLNILKTLPSNTKVYCGHEYTLNNLKFALHVEPDNSAIANKIKVSEESLKKNEPTVPSTIADELSYNPFLRIHVQSIQNFTQQINPIAVIKVLREQKDNFKS